MWWKLLINATGCFSQVYGNSSTMISVWDQEPNDNYGESGTRQFVVMWRELAAMINLMQIDGIHYRSNNLSTGID